jgi:levanbiose-producing levanase
MRIYVDESSVEVFGNDGQAVFSNVVFPDGASDGMSFYTKGGNVKIVSLNVYPLAGIWKDESTEGTSPNKVVMDHSKLELRIGQSHRLSTSILPRSAKNQKIKWQTSNPAIAEVKKIDESSADVKLVGYGRATISAVANNGKVIGETVVESKTSYKIGKALTVAGTSNGSKVKIRPKRGTLEQVWNIEGEPSGIYKVLSQNSNKVLDASGTSNGDDVQIWEYFGYGNQQWRIIDNWDGTVTFNVVNSGKALEVPDRNIEDGTVVEINEINSEASQKWKLIEVPSSK